MDTSGNLIALTDQLVARMAHDTIQEFKQWRLAYCKVPSNRLTCALAKDAVYLFTYIHHYGYIVLLQTMLGDFSVALLGVISSNLSYLNDALRSSPAVPTLLLITTAIAIYHRLYGQNTRRIALQERQRSLDVQRLVDVLVVRLEKDEKLVRDLKLFLMG